MHNLPRPGPPIRERIIAVIDKHQLDRDHDCPCGQWWVRDTTPHAVHLADAIVAELQLTVEDADNVAHALGVPRQRRWVTPWERTR